MGLIVLGCSGDDAADGGGDGVAIENRPLSGVVGGQSWTFARGETDAFLSEGEPDYWVDLYASAGTACETSPFDSGNHLILQAPREPGEYRLSLMRNATFVIEGETIDNLVATTGRVVVDDVTGTSITGGAYLRFDDDNVVNGRFEIAICP